MRAQRGMSLVETLIVLAIAAAVIGAIIFMLQRDSERDRQENAVRLTGQELANLASASKQYVDANKASWANGTRNVVTIQSLITAGFLPTGFAARGGATPGVTPVGQNYSVISIKDGVPFDDPLVPDGTVRTIILDAGNANAGRLERAGVANLPDALQAFKEAIALYTTREENVPMGVLPAGSSSVTGIGRVFTKDLLIWIANPLPNPAVVALVGFPDLDGTDDTGGPGTAAQKYDDCQVIPDYYGCPGGQFATTCSSWTAPSCPSGWTDLGHPRGCGLGGATTTSTDVGLLVSGPARESTQRYTCKADITTSVYQVVSLSGAEIYRQHCTYSTEESEWRDPPLPGPRVCTTFYQQSGNVISSGVTGGRNVYGKLCCLPRP